MDPKLEPCYAHVMSNMAQLGVHLVAGGASVDTTSRSFIDAKERTG